MAVEIEREHLVTFRELASKLPSRRPGRSLHVSTIHRWRHPGVQDVQLEAVRMGGSWITSWEAFVRFCRRLTRARDAAAQGATSVSTDKQNEQINRALDAAGL